VKSALSLLRDIVQVRTVRARLMLWNICALALILGMAGCILRYMIRTNLMRSVDRELALRSVPFLVRREPRFGGPLPGPRPAGNGAMPAFYAPPLLSLLMPLPENRDRLRDRRPASPELTRARQGRPRVFDLQGNPQWNASDTLWDRAAFRRAAQGQTLHTTIAVEGEPYRIYSAPVRADGVIVGVVQTALPLSDINRAVTDMGRTLLTLVPVALLLAGLGGAFLTNRALRPVQSLAQTAQQIGAQDLSRRLPVIGRDEFSRLAKTFNAMLARLESAFLQKEELVRQLKDLVEQQRRFTADASHELRTPLTIIKANTSLALRGQATEADYREAVEEIDRAADTMNRLVQDLLLLARSDGGQLGRNVAALSAAAVLEQAEANVQARCPAPICLDIPDPALAVMGNPDEIVRLFTNLLENAAHHTPHEGRITMAARSEQDDVLITVTDTGVGIAPEHLPHLGERFYRVDPSRSRPDGGAGLGLSICRSIVAAHGGTLTIESVVGKGTSVRVTLPRA
jgi:signal transduction histidine kinase